MKKFGELLFETIDDTMRKVFGESACELIYRLMGRQVLLKREEVGENIEAFYAYLEKLIGLEGAQIIQSTSFKRLFHKLRREYKKIERYFSFLDELYEYKFRLLASLLKEERSVCN